MIRKAKLSMGDVAKARAEEDRLVLRLSDGSQTAFEVPEVELSLGLKSGRRTVRLNAASLASRVSRLLAPG